MCIIATGTYAQEDGGNSSPGNKLNTIYFGVEAGAKTFNTYCPDYDFMRQEAVEYYDYYSSQVETSMSSYSFSLKAEYRALSDKLWISSGINYSHVSSLMGKLSSDDEYFYIRLNQEQDNTYYYKIEQVSENTHYIGVPIDFRFSPYDPRFFRVYFKFGVDVNFTVATDKDVTFNNEEMEVYEDQIADLFDEPELYCVFGAIGVGFQWGRQGKPNLRVEAELPAVNFTEDAIGLINQNYGGGASMSLLIPFKSK